VLGITGVSDFVHHPMFEKLENITFRKLDLFPSSGEGEMPTLLDPVERANLNDWTTHVRVQSQSNLTVAVIVLM
jgi:hypothetical protein